jgi:hypothetical protein
VRIEADSKQLSHVVVFLTKAEAAELRDGVEDLLVRFHEKEWHVHVASADYQVELILAPDVATGL